MPQLDVSTFPSQIFWLIVCFAVLCLAMVTILVPRMSRTLAHRSNELEMLRQKTEELMIETNKLNRINEERLHQAKVKAQGKINQITIDLAKLKDDKIHEFETRLHQHAIQMQSTLDTHKQEILTSSQGMIRQLVQDMYLSLTGHPADALQLETVKTSKKKDS